MKKLPLRVRWALFRGSISALRAIYKDPRFSIRPHAPRTRAVSELEFVTRIMIRQFLADMKRTHSAIVRPPGSAFRTVLSFLCTKRTMKLVFEPVLADLQHEHMEALGEGRPWLARWVRLRGYYSLLASFAAQMPLTLLRWAIEMYSSLR